MSADRRILNPLYSDNRLKLGVFGANVSKGCAATTAPGHLEDGKPLCAERRVRLVFAGIAHVRPASNGP
jgi:hypothetical protein